MKLCLTVIQFKRVTDRLFTVIVYRNVMYWVICLCQLVFTVIQHVFKISTFSMHACFASMEWMHQWCIISMLCQECSRCCRNLLCWDDVTWCSWHSEKTIKLKYKSVKQKYLLDVSLKWINHPMCQLFWQISMNSCAFKHLRFGNVMWQHI